MNLEANPSSASEVGAADDQVLTAIAAGDRSAFAVWLRKAEPTLRRSLRRFAADVDVEAVLQETLLRAWQLAPRVQADAKGESLLRLSMRMARNLAIDEARRHRGAPLTEVDKPEPIEPSLPPDPWLRAHIATCQGSLPKKPLAALSARMAAAGMRRESEVAKSLGMAPNTYLQNLTRARRLILACLQRLGVPINEVIP